MAKTREVRGWTVEETGDRTLTISKGKRPPLIMVYSEGMDGAVVDEYIATRTIEAELDDQGASGYGVTANGVFSGNAGDASQALVDAYVDQVMESRLRQQMREVRRRREERD